MKKTLTFILVIIAALFLVACNKGGSSSGKTQIEFWHMSPVGSESYSDMRKIIKKYNDSQDEFEVVGKGFAFWDYWDKLDTAISSKVAPDVGLSTLDDVVRRAAGGVLYNISELMANDTNDYKLEIDQYRENQLKFARYNGDLFAMPFTSTTRALFYNIDMFESIGLTEADVPKTWSELEEVAHKFDVFKDGRIERIGFDPTYGNAKYHNWLWQAGLDFFDENLLPTLNTPKHVEILEWVANFNNQYSRSQLQAFGEGNQMLGINPFAAERVAMIVEVDGLYQIIKDAGATFNYGVTSIPIPDENGIHVNWGSGFSIELYKNGKGDPDKMAGAFDFLKYLMSYQTQIDLAEANGWIMGHIQGMVDWTKGNKILEALLKEVDTAIDKVYIPYAPSWHGNDWEPFYSDVLEGRKTAAEALEAARNNYLQKKENYDKTNK